MTVSVTLWVTAFMALVVPYIGGGISILLFASSLVILFGCAALALRGEEIRLPILALSLFWRRISSANRNLV
jgi:uncharacterized membrane protein